MRAWHPGTLPASNVQEKFTFRLTNDLAEVPQFRERFVGACVRVGIRGDELDAWKLVFTELVCNAIEHGCATAGDSVRIAYEITAGIVAVEVVDPGECMPELETLFDRTETDFSETGRGAGLILIRHFTDEISVRPVEGGGTRVRVVRFRVRGADGGPVKETES
jgi:anti-sigma regulatory factor (Ser/Thr protein kinase)